MRHDIRQAIASWRGYVLALVSVVAATWARLAMDPWLGAGGAPTFTYIAAVAAVAFTCGRGPALVATFAGWIACDYFVTPPRHALLASYADVLPMLFFAATGALVSILAGRMRRMQLLAEGRARSVQEHAEQLQRHRTLLHTVASGTDVMLVYLDRDFNFVFVNDAYAKTCGMRPEEMIGRNHFALYPNAENEAIFRNARDSGTPVFYKDKPFEFPDQPARGVTYWDWSLAPVKDDAGVVTNLVFSLRETTPYKRADLERQQIEDALSFLVHCGANGEDFFQSLARYLADALGVTYVCIDRLSGDRLTAQTLAIYSDGRFEDNVCYTLKDTPCGDVVGEKICCFPAGVRRLFPRDDVLQQMEAEGYLGATLWSGQGVPIGLIAAISRHPIGNVRAASAVLQAASVRAAGELERAEAQRALALTADRYRQLFESMSEGFATGEVLFDADGHSRDFRFLDMNAAFERQTGLTRDVLGRPMRDLLPHLERYWADRYGAVVLTGKADRFTAYNEDTKRHYDVAAYRPETGRFAIVFHDVTEVMKKEEALCESEDLARRRAEELEHEIRERRRADEMLRRQYVEIQAIYDSVDVGLAVLDRDLRFLRVNQKMAELNGCSAEAHIGRTVREILPALSEHAEAAIRHVIETGEPLRDLEIRGTTDAQPGVDRTWIEQWIPLKDDRGTVVGINVSAAEVTHERDVQGELRTANRRKEDFMAVLSHELRTPLTPVLAAVSMLQRRLRADQSTMDALEMIRRNVEVQARLIDDLLDVARITRGKIELNRRPVLLRSIVDRALEVVQPDIEAKHLHLDVSQTGYQAIVEADAARVQQAFWNLLRNAIKFTPDGGRIRVSCSADDDGHALVEVRDSGEGMDPAVLARIFEPFEQGERNAARQFGGLGLGLTISRSIVELHGGSIEAHSNGKGQGATFRVRLPISRVAPHDARPASCAPVAVHPRRILLVEDDGDTAQMLAQLLSADGHHVEVAGSVSNALRAVDGRAFDLLICDLGLPDGTGLDLMRELRARNSALPGIVLSGYGQEEDVRRSREAGFAEHLIKPSDLERLPEVITSITERGEVRSH